MSGHVFVVHGRIEDIVHDYAIVPTSDNFHVRYYWFPLTGDPPGPVKPEGWPGQRFGRARDGRNVWFVSVAGIQSKGPKVVIDRAVQAIAEIAALAGATSEHRFRRLVAVPFLGIRGGGLGDRRGEVVRDQLEAMSQAADRYDIDIAIVTPESTVYAAAQYLRRERNAWPLPAEMVERAKSLGDLASEGQLALFLGAGVSIPAGLPTWAQLVARLAANAHLDVDARFQDLSVLDQAQLIERRLDNLGEQVAELVRPVSRPAIGHALLSALGCRSAVTTNYDQLYETAVRMQGGDELATILPWEAPRAGRPWLLKMHGDIDRVDTIVLTRAHFVGFDRSTRPAGALLQSLLMTRHVLFVGASLNDDNVIRLAYEVDSFRKLHGVKGAVGTLLDIENDPLRRELWEGQVEWLSMTGETIPECARSLEIFLDAVAAFASRSHSWLLDTRFAGLLDEADRELVRRLNECFEDIDEKSPAWRSLAGQLVAHGAGAEEYDEEREHRRVLALRWRTSVAERYGDLHAPQ